ncbi:hypothetical protein [Rugosimonospora africana]|uniref:Uncharacterized protein n=1 Tax=Rugosimonospora africana TaxID=556532 RepID=A0A8J3QR69_9ACTN|nr:hypothetical protein [Rugosimonospora africana]GIH15094.1 hypothetical protein Raf01_32660 [Rugosimonospora africana]
MTTDDAIRDALEHLAHHSPDPERTLRGLAGRQRAMRQRRMLTLAGGMVAAGAVVGAPLFLMSRQHAARPAGAAGTSGSGDGIPLRYRPGWLPAGMVEVLRMVGADAVNDPDLQLREWRNPGTGRRVRLIVGGASSVVTEGRQRITVQGVSGFVDPDIIPRQNAVAIIWEAALGALVQVVVDVDEPGSLAVPMRIANSVTRDGKSALTPRLAFGWLPANTHESMGRQSHGSSIVMASPHGWAEMATYSEPYSAGAPLPHLDMPDGLGPVSDALSFGVTATIGPVADVGPSVPAAGGAARDTVTVRGTRGVFVSPQILQIPLPKGRTLRVAGAQTRPDLVRIADSLRIGPDPDVSWVGRR